MNEPLISVIVPVYKAENYLEECVKSVVNQTYKNLEIILVDDGSPDSCPMLCDDWAKKDSRIKVIHKENGGVSKARNVALEMAKGEYVGFIDSDDTIELDMYESLINNSLKTKCDLVTCNITRVEYGVPQNQYYDFCDCEKILSQEEALEGLLLMKAFGGGPCNKLFKTSIIKNIRFDENIYYGEDMLFLVEVILNCREIFWNPKSFYNYYSREGSACNSAFDEKKYSLHLAHVKIIDVVEKRNAKMREYAHSSLLLFECLLLTELCYEKNMRKKYSNLIRQNIKKHTTIKRIKKLPFLRRLDIILVNISCRVFFSLLKIKQLINELL